MFFNKKRDCMLKRKIKEISSVLYRNLIYPFKRMRTERKTGSTMLPGSYLFKDSRLLGKNYLGKRTVLRNTEVGFGSYLNNGCDMTDTIIGKYTSIGTNVRTVLGSHPLNGQVALHPAFFSKSGAMGYTYVSEDNYEDFKYIDKDKKIQVVIGSDVWIGDDVRILGGNKIADGCVIGTGSIVTKDTVPYGIYAGVPAKLIRKRFDDDKIAALLEMKWWDKGEDFIKEHIEKFYDVNRLIECNKAE